MKIAFDQNVPFGMVRVFQSLAKERKLRRDLGGLEIVTANDYAPDPSDEDYIRGNDVPWLVRFARDGGKVVVSGDTRMRTVPHELIALKQYGFVVIFFEQKWNGWDFFKKSSLLLYHWKLVAKKAKSAKPGTFWSVPGHWKDDRNLRRIGTPRQNISKFAPRSDRNLSERGKEFVKQGKQTKV